ncbi:DUF4272 domain-containing protein [Bremerella cremea]|uniref:DUF4272 domain-containing protein n=1 Tax=Bremerella cremea TaxID=1031537 RepID=A0A368KPH2_9BACT|nr:DUF4272 domain-containing protein [Bremerella cremea]RCS41410.1 DUF4272 domain-containing protein [Bremerella cremea]
MSSTPTLVNAYCTRRNPPPLEFPHQLLSHRNHHDPKLATHLQEFIGFVCQGGQREMTETLYHVIQHLERVQNQYSLEIYPEHFDKLGNWARAANAVLLMQDFNVCDPTGKLLVSHTDGSYDDDAEVPYTEEALQRKERITTELGELALHPYEGLPPVIAESEVDLRPADEVARRALALMAVAVRAESLASDEPLPVSEIRQRLPQAFGSFTPVEKAFMEAESPDQQSVINHAWRYECLYVLQWALGHFDELQFPNTICDVTQVAGDILNRDRAAMIAEAKLRPTTEILDQADRYFRLHWIARQPSLKGEPTPAGLDIGVISERRHALNWLIRHQNADWDDVNCST